MRPELTRRTNRLYGDLAWLWPILSDPADYRNEARQWLTVLRAELGEGRHRVLELGVGGGHNLFNLAGEFEVTAVDLSEAMLEISARLNPAVSHVAGDMRTVRLGSTFDAVLIHDAISYLLTEDDLRRTFATAAVHLRPEGVLVIAPDFYRETFPDPFVEVQEPRRQGNLEVTYYGYTHNPDPSDTVIESIMLYFIRQDGRLRIEEDLHRHGLFPLETWTGLMAAAGFEVRRHMMPADADDPRQPYLLVGRQGVSGRAPNPSR